MKRCTWLGCKLDIPRTRVMCPAHWPLLPPDIRTRLWAAYRTGQDTGQASNHYLQAAREAAVWIRAHGLDIK